MGGLPSVSGGCASLASTPSMWSCSLSPGWPSCSRRRWPGRNPIAHGLTQSTLPRTSCLSRNGVLPPVAVGTSSRGPYRWSGWPTCSSRSSPWSFGPCTGAHPPGPSWSCGASPSLPSWHTACRRRTRTTAATGGRRTASSVSSPLAPSRTSWSDASCKVARLRRTPRPGWSGSHPSSPFCFRCWSSPERSSSRTGRQPSHRAPRHPVESSPCLRTTTCCSSPSSSPGSEPWLCRDAGLPDGCRRARSFSVASSPTRYT